MSKSRMLIAAALLLAASGLAFAQEAPKYSYIEAGYIDFDPEGGLSDDGFFAGGSMNLFKNFHLLAEYDDVGDYTFWNAGVGWHGLFGEPGDLFAEVVWNDVQVDSSDVSDDGYEVAGGVRWKLVKWLELKGKVTWLDYSVDPSDAGSDTAFEAQALFTFMDDRLGIGAAWETADDDTLRAFLRFNFGK